MTLLLSTSTMDLIVDGTMNVSGTATVGTLNAAAGSIFLQLYTGTNGSALTDFIYVDISFGNENLTTTGTMSAATGSTTIEPNTCQWIHNGFNWTHQFRRREHHDHGNTGHQWTCHTFNR